MRYSPEWLNKGDWEAVAILPSIREETGTLFRGSYRSIIELKARCISLESSLENDGFDTSIDSTVNRYGASYLMHRLVFFHVRHDGIPIPQQADGILG
jgi:hypothetical protein